MKCQCCDRLLSNYESTRKFASGTYIDMCNKCLDTIADDVSVIDDETMEYNEYDDKTI